MATTPFNAADYLKTPEDMLVFLDEAYASGDRAVVAAALRSIIEAARRDERKNCADAVLILETEGNPQFYGDPDIPTPCTRLLRSHPNYPK